jgi:hypothetical protein
MMNERLIPVSITFDAMELEFDLASEVSYPEPFPDANKTIMLVSTNDIVSILGTEEELEAVADSILLCVTANKVERARLEEWNRNQKKEW